MEDFPKRHSQIQDAQTSDCAPDPTRSNHTLQTIETGLTRGVQKEVVVSPITQAEKSLRYPGQQREYNADFQAEDNVEDDAELGRHDASYRKSLIVTPYSIATRLSVGGHEAVCSYDCDFQLTSSVRLLPLLLNFLLLVDFLLLRLEF